MKLSSLFAPSVRASEPLTDALWGALEATGAVLTLKDSASGSYLRTSESTAKLLGWPTELDPIGRTDAELMDPSTAMALRAADSQAMAQGGIVRTEHQLPVRGQRHDLLAMRQSVPAAGAQPARMLCVWSDPSDSRRKDAQMHAALEQLESQQQAYLKLRRELEDQRVRDTITGLYHRAHFEEQARRELDLSVREQREFAIVSIAVDGLDALAAGDTSVDTALESIGRLLRSNTRTMDAPCRLDQGRFLVLLSGCGLATAHSRMEGLRKQCESHIVVVQGQEQHFTLSMGVSSFPHTASTLDDLLETANLALDDARSKGGNRVSLAGIRFAPK